MSLSAWLLTALLAFATATAFVRDAWAVESFEAATFALFAVVVTRSQARIRSLLPFLLPLFGLAQLAFSRTASPYETRAAVLHWAALAAVFFLACHAGLEHRSRYAFLKAFLVFSVALAVLCILQLFTSEGRVLWLFASGYRDVYGTFASPNNYAQFVELALPAALWLALREPRNALSYAIAGGVMYGSVIGSTSRMGALLCTLELATFILIGVLSYRKRAASMRTAVLVLVPAAAAVFTTVVGWEQVWERFHQQDPYVLRREYFEAAINMTVSRPLTGHGLGTFPVISDAFAVKDFPFYANHVHNDWLEFAADGGILFALLVLSIFAARIPAMFRHPWSLGLLAAMLHAGVDYPFPRSAVSGWMFALLGLLAASEAE